MTDIFYLKRKKKKSDSLNYPPQIFCERNLQNRIFFPSSTFSFVIGGWFSGIKKWWVLWTRTVLCATATSLLPEQPGPTAVFTICAFPRKCSSLPFFSGDWAALWYFGDSSPLSSSLRCFIKMTQSSQFENYCQLQQFCGCIWFGSITIAERLCSSDHS